MINPLRCARPTMLCLKRLVAVSASVMVRAEYVGPSLMLHGGLAVAGSLTLGGVFFTFVVDGLTVGFDARIVVGGHLTFYLVSRLNFRQNHMIVFYFRLTIMFLHTFAR